MRTVTALAALFLLLVPSHPASAGPREDEEARCERKVWEDTRAEVGRQNRREACRLHPDKECKAWAVARQVGAGRKGA